MNSGVGDILIKSLDSLVLWLVFLSFVLFFASFIPMWLFLPGMYQSLVSFHTCVRLTLWLYYTVADSLMADPDNHPMLPQIADSFHLDICRGSETMDALVMRLWIYPYWFCL